MKTSFEASDGYDEDVYEGNWVEGKEEGIFKVEDLRRGGISYIEFKKGEVIRWDVDASEYEA